MKIILLSIINFHNLFCPLSEIQTYIVFHIPLLFEASFKFPLLIETDRGNKVLLFISLNGYSFAKYNTIRNSSITNHFSFPPRSIFVDASEPDPRVRSSKTLQRKAGVGGWKTRVIYTVHCAQD